MADELKFEASAHNFACGNEYANLSVVKITGPNGSRAHAYCSPMNLDLDGQPQAYGPFSKPKLRPMDYLGNAGWLRPDKNAAAKAEYELLKLELARLEKQKATAPPAGASPASGPPSKLDTDIHKLRARVSRKSYEHLNQQLNPSTTNPKNFEKIFWHWYGLVSLTPQQAYSTPPFAEPNTGGYLRKPVLDTTPDYEDVFGRFPVVQSIFEPGPGYFVSALTPAGGVNKLFPPWDQRYMILPDSVSGDSEQGAFGALSSGLTATANLKFRDRVFAMRTDTNDTIEFPFRDFGHGYKVGECSFAAFTGLGGIYYPQFDGAAKFPNKFLVLYLAFPDGQAPQSVLAKLQTAANASDLIAILSFIVRSTANAKQLKKDGPRVASEDPVREFKAWKKAGSKAPLSHDAVVSSGLSQAGVADFVTRMMKRHPGVMSGGLTISR